MYKLSSSVKTSLGVGKIAMTQKRLFLLTEGRPGYVEIATFRDMEVGAARAAPGLGGSAARADPRTPSPASHGPRLSLLTCQVGWDGTDLVGNALRAVGVPGGLPCVGGGTRARSRLVLWRRPGQTASEKHGCCTARPYGEGPRARPRAAGSHVSSSASWRPPLLIL